MGREEVTTLVLMRPFRKSCESNCNRDFKRVPSEACLIERSNTLYPDDLNKQNELNFNHVSFSVVFNLSLPSVLI